MTQLEQKISEEERTEFLFSAFSKEVTTKDIAKYIKFERGSPIINWRVIEGINPEEQTYSTDVYNCIINLLIGLDVLSFEDKGNFTVSGGGLLNLNPTYGVFPLFLTREEYAKEYAQAKYGDNAHSIKIIKL